MRRFVAGGLFTFLPFFAVSAFGPSIASAGGDGTRASLDVTPPPSFREDHTLGPPDLSQTPQSHVSAWRAFSDGSGASLVAACFETPTETWAPEAEPLALDKMTQIVASTAIRSGHGGQVSAGETRREGEVVTRALGGDTKARIFLGFVRPGGDAVLTSCLVLCSDSSCGASVDTANVRGPFVRAPEPSLGVRTLLAMVHHPGTTGWVIAGTVCLGGAIAVATRRRPRRRQKDPKLNRK